MNFYKDSEQQRERESKREGENYLFIPKRCVCVLGFFTESESKREIEESGSKRQR